jgi:putative transposase
VLVVEGGSPENRLHEGIGYVTPNDEHEGRGPAIRAARTEGLQIADEQRRDWHHQQQQPANNQKLLSESTQQMSR